MKLESINELLNFLNPNRRDAKKCLDGMKSVDIQSIKMKDYLYWDDSNYTRNLISKTESFELLACCWEPGQSSVLHDLNGQLGWIKIISGNLDFTVTKINGQVGKEEVKALTINDLFTHQVKSQMYKITNNSNERAVSLHLYSMPISYYNVLTGNGTDVENINIAYHSINGTLIKNK